MQSQTFIMSTKISPPMYTLVRDTVEIDILLFVLSCPPYSFHQREKVVIKSLCNEDVITTKT